MFTKRAFLGLCCLGCLLFFMSLYLPAALGQMGGTGGIVGTVTDPSGAAVVGATVTLTDTTTGSARTSTTNEAGRYVFSNVPPGTYNLAISKEGFRQTKFSNLVVNVGASLTLDAKVEMGAISQSVEVTATNSDLQTMNATVGNTITGVALEALPSLGRDVSTFVTLQPGVAMDGSVAGANQDQNSFLLDGGNNSSDMDGTQNTYTPSFAGDPSGGLVNALVTGTSPAGSPGGGAPTGVMPTPVDSIEEFKVGTSNQTADFNSSAGAQVQLVTKRGTNTIHGTVYEYYLDNNWSANTFDNNATGTNRPSYHYSHFGAAGGGPLIPKSILGGKTYIFANYEGFRFPNAVTVTKAVPSALLRQGIIQMCPSTDKASSDGTQCLLNGAADGVPTQYNFNPAKGPMTTACTITAANPTGACDPLSLGISPTMQALWQFMPTSNTSSCSGLSRCDHLNVQEFKANMPLVWNDNFGVVRLDHDFGPKWHANSTYRYYKMQRATTNQVDIGGFFSGDKLGVPSPASNRPQVPWYLTAGLTTNITPNLTNDFHWSYLRNHWARASNAQPPQVTGLGGALEPFGETSSNVLAPFNLDTQNVRTRFWDGQDHMIRDDLSLIKGRHFFQFGGTYQRNWNWHQRTDNGGGINYNTVYWLGSSVGSTNGMDMTNFIPAGVPSTAWKRLYGIVLGVPGVTQIAYTRTGPNLTLNPPNTPAFDQSTIPFYNLYFSDSWRMKPTITLNYGLGWTLEMPPVEANGKQVELVDQAGQQIDTVAYLNARKAAALQGQVYNPEVGFALVGNTGGGQKYPYRPFYGSFSPRVAVAWNPNFSGGIGGKAFGPGKTVIRSGFSMLYGRLNGVDLVLVPLLGTGLIQAVQCVSPVRNDPQCLNPGNATPFNAFRIGPAASGWNGLVAPLPVGSQTLPQPDFPGINAVAAGAGEGLDPNFRPSVNYQFDLTLQRQINNRVSIEFGYIGRKITHEFQPIQINSVPYMMTKGGQRFDKAYGQMVMQFCGGNAGLAGGGCNRNLAAVTPQPFFENALNPAYCAGFASCTAAVASNEASNIQNANVWTIWSDLDNGAFNFPRSMMNTPIPGSPLGGSGQLSSGVGMNTSLGYGNYNAGFVTIKTSNWRGLTLQSNFTYSKALGTGSQVQATSQYTAIDPFDLSADYGVQPWDRKFTFNTWLVYQPPFFKSQHGVLGRIAGGWTIAPLLASGSGLPLQVSPSDNAGNDTYGGGQAFGEADGTNFGGQQNAILICPNNFGSSRHDNPKPSSFGGNGFGPSFFQDPAAAYQCFRNPILGIDSGHNGGAGTLRGMPFWNVDLSVKKDIVVTERYHLEFSSIFTNVFNHNQLFDPGNPGLVIGEPDNWGALEGQVNTPRKMEFGLRVRF